MLALNSAITEGKRWYLTSPDNKRIYNVTVSRAKACLIIVGDRNAARSSSLRELRMLADPRPLDTGGAEFDSPYEMLLHDAMARRGIKTISQYPMCGYFFDFAYIENGMKLDIEVDGVAYHTNADGSRKQHDIQRDIVAERNGWKVLRFWSSEIDEDLEGCVDTIANEIAVKGRKGKII